MSYEGAKLVHCNGEGQDSKALHTFGTSTF